MLDYEILSRLCEKCSIWTEDKQKDKPSEYEKWLERHKPNCNRNYTGSSQAMEPEAAQRIWGRRLERNRLVYSVFVGDGDSKAFQRVTTLNPYPLVKVQKEECLTHVAKRLKKNLKKLSLVQRQRLIYSTNSPNGKRGGPKGCRGRDEFRWGFCHDSGIQPAHIIVRHARPLTSRWLGKLSCPF